MLALAGTVANFTNDGTITNTKSNGIYVNGLITNFTNNKVIDSEVYAIVTSNSGKITNFNNTGTFTANANTIAGPINNFTNSGEITARTGDTAIRITDSKEFNNSGTITANANTVTATGQIDSFTNSGEIIARTGNKALSMVNSFTNFHNTGTITANTTEAVYINANGDTFRNDGTITAQTGNAVNIAQNKTITTLNNAGTITTNTGSALNIEGKINNLSADTNSYIYGSNAVISINKGVGNLTLKGTLKVGSGGGSAVYLKSGATMLPMDTLHIDGGKIVGVDFANNGLLQLQENVNTIVVDNGAIIGKLKQTSQNKTSGITINDIEMSNGKGIQVHKSVGSIEVEGRGTYVEGINAESSSASIASISVRDATTGTISASNQSTIGDITAYNASIDKVTTNSNGKITSIHNLNQTTIDTIALNSGSIDSILNTQGTINGITIDSGSIKTISNNGQSAINNQITLSNNGSITSIINTDQASISGIALSSSSKIDSIINTDQANINNGITLDNSPIDTIANNATIKGGITLNNHSAINSIMNTDRIEGDIVTNSNSTLGGIINQAGATITGEIIHGGSGTLEVDSRGIIEGNGGTHLGNTGSGKMIVRDVLVSTDNTHHITGNKEVYFDLVTIDINNKAIPTQIDNILSGDYDLCKISRH